MVTQFRQSFAHVVLEDFLVNEHTYHVTVVVERQVTFDYLRHGPERLFFLHASE